MRRLLIISSDYTGHGQKSISDALQERLAAYDDLEIRTINGFSLMTKVQQACAEKTYGPITRLPGNAWAIQYSMGMKLQELVQYAMSAMIRHKFQDLIKEFMPDCILSVHPMFLGSVLDLLEEMDLKIPLVAHEADLIDIAVMWFDPRLAMVLTPSKESYECTVKNVTDPSRVHQVGFPVRKRFMGLAEQGRMTLHDPLTITVMSGSEGSGMIHDVAKALLHGTNAQVNVICGRNKVLRKWLRKALIKDYYGRVNVMGFVDHIQDIMAQSDILVMRASPNSVMEAVALNKPVILFGQLAGQEKHNPDMMQAHGIAIYCDDPDKLPDCVEGLLKNDGEMLERMRGRQREYAPGDDAADTAKLLNDFIKPIHE